MREVTKEDLTNELEQVVIQVMDEAIDNDFTEDTITGNLLKNIKEVFTANKQKHRSIGVKIILDDDLYKYVALEAYKVRSKAEQNFGDILGITCLGSDHLFYIGMFSLEAKVVENSRIKYFNYDQLQHLLRNNVFIKWLIYDVDRGKVDVINPRLLLHSERGRPLLRSFGPFTIPFNIYIIEFLLNGNDSFMFLKKGADHYEYPPYGGQTYNAYQMIQYYIDKTKRLSQRRPPSYILTVGSSNDNISFEESLKILNQIVSTFKDMFPNHKVAEIDEDIDFPPKKDNSYDPRPPTFGPSL